LVALWDRQLTDIANASLNHDYDAELREWAFRHTAGVLTGFGRVYGDQKGRWPDGYAIATSAVTHGRPEEGEVITTRNTRYLLSGPPGDLEEMLKLAQDLAANGARRAQVAQDERLFDLLPAAWGMDDATFEQVAGLPAKWLWQWRNHYRAPTDQELARIRRLMSFHEAISLVAYGEANYPAWWRRKWRKDSLIGSRSPLGAVLAEGDPMMDRLECCFRSQAGW
jgi:hypothetical protein